jgi:transcriptional regulator GlxA family with amidase domain
LIPVYCIVAPNVLLLDLAGPVEVFRIAERFDIRYCGPEASVQSSVGVTIGNIAPLPETVEPNAIVLVAGTTGRAVSAPVVKWLKRHADARIFTVCSGALTAARAGLLKNKACTTHHTLIEALKALEPTAKVLENRLFVHDGSISTSAGITSGVDLALQLVADHASHQLAAAVAREMVVYMRRAGHDPQLSPWLDGRNHLHPAVHKVQDAITERPAADWTLQRMAKAGHTSPRQLGRLFTEHVGQTPIDYLHRVRIALANDLVRTTSASLENVAEKAGFGSLRQMRRVWRKVHQNTPSELLRNRDAPQQLGGDKARGVL